MLRAELGDLAVLGHGAQFCWLLFLLDEVDELELFCGGGDG